MAIENQQPTQKSRPRSRWVVVVVMVIAGVSVAALLLGQQMMAPPAIHAATSAPSSRDIGPSVDVLDPRSSGPIDKRQPQREEEVQRTNASAATGRLVTVGHVDETSERCNGNGRRIPQRNARYWTPRARRVFCGEAPSSDLRVAIPLLLTHTGYHGTALLAKTIEGWIMHFLEKQQVDLLLFHDRVSAPIEAVVKLLGLSAAQRPTVDVADDANSGDDDDGSPVGYYTIPRFSKTYVIRVYETELPLPRYAETDPAIRAKIVNDSTWLKCGCPPYCPAKRATVDYVQGTRWYTDQLFRERRFLLRRRYDYWIKLDVDIWMFRPPPFHLGERIALSGAIFAHTGTAYNGAGCSNELHKAITAFCDGPPPAAEAGKGGGGGSEGGPRRKSNTSTCPMVSRNHPFWKQDDTVFYSNFVVSSVGFHTDGLPGPFQQARQGRRSSDARRSNISELGLVAAPSSAEGLLATPYELAHGLNEYPTGFFRYRWTDQSLFHKVFGVFVGPAAEDYALDWSGIRCEKKRFKRGACFRHTKRVPSWSELKKCTDL